jgi:hypothetical protein
MPTARLQNCQTGSRLPSGIRNFVKGKAMIVKKVNLAQGQFTKTVVYGPVPGTSVVPTPDKK